MVNILALNQGEICIANYIDARPDFCKMPGGSRESLQGDGGSHTLQSWGYLLIGGEILQGGGDTLWRGRVILWGGGESS